MDLIAQFDGATFEPERDGERLSSQLGRVKGLMLDGKWRSLPTIASLVGGSEAGVSARLRDLRKRRNGAYMVNRRYMGEGLCEYQVIA